MQEIKSDIKRSITSPPFWIATILMVVTIIIGVDYKNLWPDYIDFGLVPYYHGTILFDSLRSEIVLMVVPILCTLPYTTAFLDEYNSGYIKTYLIKCDKTAYIRGKVIAPVISGGLVFFIGIIAFYIIASLFYSPLELYDKQAVSPFLDVLKISLLFLFSGGLWASVGALLANLSLSKYMAYASPFVIFYVLVILAERYFRDIYILSPKEWLRLDYHWVINEWGAMVLMILLTLVICMINDVIIEKRIKEL